MTTIPSSNPAADALFQRAEALRRNLSGQFRDQLVQSLYTEAEAIAQRAVKPAGNRQWDLDQRLDQLVTSPVFGLPIMLVILATVFWVTVAGANVPSAMLADALFWVEEQGVALFNALGLPWWVTGFLWNGVYRGLAWVVSVMLPPMAIFFPCFTILEDLGYLPRVAFNLDWLFKKAGAHGKQSLTMTMGWGCNAAGIVATRIIDSPRERLIAILTNNFSPCNGRFPTLILLATVFVAAAFPPELASLIAAGSVVVVVVLGVIFSLITSAFLSRTWLKGEASAFTLELPPYRRPNIGRILYTSLIDRTIFLLWRAMQTAAPAGAITWILGNIIVGDQALALHIADFLKPLGVLIGLDGVILLTYLIAIPANEIVAPTMLMMYMGVGAMTDVPSYSELTHLLVTQNGWTMLTAVNLMLFSLLHNPCATTIVTMWKETRSVKWTTLGALLPLGMGFVVCFITATVARLLGWV
jgi:ferrous iron transport protein B